MAALEAAIENPNRAMQTLREALEGGSLQNKDVGLMSAEGHISRIKRMLGDGVGGAADVKARIVTNNLSLVQFGCMEDTRKTVDITVSLPPGKILHLLLPVVRQELDFPVPDAKTGIRVDTPAISIASYSEAAPPSQLHNVQVYVTQVAGPDLDVPPSTLVKEAIQQQIMDAWHSKLEDPLAQPVLKNADCLIVGSPGMKVRLWNLDSPTTVQPLSNEFCVAFSRAGPAARVAPDELHLFFTGLATAGQAMARKMGMPLLEPGHPGDPDEPGAKRPALPGGTPME
ncbi:hypothetical protein GPECTOR_286g763 [Gonium pectorale]|uniref:Uncharacterized protein n=1 Tax=Gonium pectorale TaxID=33097 RepID=A0A150FVZ2_GONPE|nr:hypothetical protein GPECTOR_286g763 [Gonium pectorale]|eukprot:KXZ41781.1 hypothetical protein GPECTOR_286g763 [Gonium pectorale]